MHKIIQHLVIFSYVFLSLPSLKGQIKIDVVVAKFPVGVNAERVRSAAKAYVMSTSPLSIAAQETRVNSQLYVYLIDTKQLNIDSLINLPAVRFVQPVRKAVEEMVINGSDLSLNTVFFSHSTFPSVNGKGLTVSVKENLPDTTDIDFRKRFFTTGLEPSIYSSHATTMMTLIGGAGNTYYTGKGAAYKTNLTSASFQILLPEPDSIYRKYKISVQNHSYGTGIENYYGVDSYAYDASINNNDSLLHVFSAGNSGTLTSTAGKYAGIPGVANLTGSFKQSKNSISVGATDSFYNVEVLSSKGPAYDGRIKPELVAFGQDGSSGAAALVSGAALLVQDAYKQKFNVVPSSSVVRAALINAADDILQPGPDYKSGFGSLNTERAVREIINDQLYTGVVNNAGVTQYNITVPPNTKELKITLAWNDIAAMPNAAKALMNDLDVELIETATGNIIYPLVLSSYPHIDSLNASAVNRRDTLNTVEQIVLHNPAAGSYGIRVLGSSVQGNQNFSVVFNMERADRFQFTYPTRNDNLFPANTNTVRWQSFTNSTTGNLDISYDAGTTWQTLNNAVNLSTHYFKAAIKDTVGLGRLRMSFPSASGNVTVLSDTFTISPKLQTNVGFNCADSFSFYWNKLSNATSYTVYALTDSFMRPQLQTTDTSVTIHTNGTKYFAVAPNIGNKTGVRSFAFDYTTQGVGCFINNFLADPVGDSIVNLKAVLGSRYQVKQIIFQRLYPTTDLITFTVNQDTFTTTDRITKEGIYYYRAKLILNNGNEVLSNVVQVVIFKERRFFVYPNPVLSGSSLVVHSSDNTESVFELFNLAGQKLYSYSLRTATTVIRLPQLQHGIYFYRMINESKNIYNGKLVVN
jgi:hypothetical protein